MRFVVGIELRVVTSPRHRNIRQPAVDEFFSCLFRGHVNKYAVGGLPLAAVACYCIAVVEMRILFDVECDGAARVEAHLQVAYIIDLLDGSQLPVRNVPLSVWRGELDAVAL